MSAGLYGRFGRKFITGQFNALNSQVEKTKRFYRRLLRDSETIEFHGLNNFAKLLRNLRSERVILAGSQFGPPLVSFAALTSLGLKVATVYWAWSETHRRILQNCGVHAIKMTEQTNRISFIRLLQKLHDDGYIIWLMCDAPGKSRIQYDFLGYTARCANLIEVHARIHGCTVIPTYCQLLSDNEASLHCNAPLTDYQYMTQRLLSNLQALIYEDPLNYLWGGSSIIFSDPQAILNGLRCLPDFLNWRDQSIARGIKVQHRKVM